MPRMMPLYFVLLMLVLSTPVIAVERSRCDSINRPDSFQYAEPNHPVELPDQYLKPTATFTPDAKVECNLEGSGFSTEPFKQHQVEHGQRNGVPYRIWYSDGSGSIPNNSENSIDDILKSWDLACKRDDIDDTRMCYAHYGDLFIFVPSKGREIVSIGHSHYPGSEVVLRIDGGAPIRASEKTGFTAAQTASIIAGLKKAKSVVTRYQEWPYQSNKDEKWDVYNFDMVLEYLRWAVKNIK